MLTQEQTKSLKKGDKIVHEIRFIEECGDYIKCSFSPLFTTDKATFLIDRSFVSLPSYHHKTVIDARDIFRNMSEGEKAMVDNFLSSYFRETEKQAKMRNALKKMGVDLTNIRTKHDPCRPFREGDVVEPKQVKGRVYSKDSKYLIGKKCIVFRDEAEPGYVVISYAGKNYSINAAYLELVTPVEELEPYELIDSPNTYNIVRDSAMVMTIHKKSHPNAKAATEAERDRLNAEYRKKQNNGNE